MKGMTAVLVWGMCLSCFSVEEYRVFIDKDGRAIEGKVIRFDSHSGKVTIERRNRRKATVPVTIFSKADQNYIQEWLSVRDFLSNKKLGISIVKKQGKAPKKNNQTQRAKPPCHYEIRLTPSKGTSFETIRIEYCMYIQTNRKRGEDSESITSERMDTVHLAAGIRQVEKTKEIKLFRNYEAKQDKSYSIYGGTTTTTSYHKTSETYLKGIRVRLYLKTPSGKEFMREICEPASLSEKCKWEKPSPKSEID